MRIPSYFISLPCNKVNPSKFWYIRKHSEKVYKAAYKKVLAWSKSFEIIRMVVLVSWFFINTFVYLYFVNLASTKWYFYGKEQDAKERIEFAHNITKLRVVDVHSDLWNNLQESTKHEVVDIAQSFVPLPSPQ